MPRRIVITGGHLTPAVATIEELQARRDWEILFIGRGRAAEAEKTPSVESKVIPGLGVKFVAIKAGRFQRRLTRWTLQSLFKVPVGFSQALFYLKRFKPDLVLSFGGYVSVPVVAAASLLKIPAITHEQTTVKGLATKINLPLVDKVAVSWPQTKALYPAEKVVFTGNPVRRSLFKKISRKAWREYGFDPKLPVVLVTSGNQGSHTINKTIEEILVDLLKEANIFHLTGHLKGMGDFERLSAKKKKLSPKLRERYWVQDSLELDKMGGVIEKVDLVIGRAGANTLTEIALFQKPAVLIPLPWLHENEQGKNAQMFARIGGVEVISQDKLTAASLLVHLKGVLGDLKRYQKEARRLKKLVEPKAAAKLVDLAEEVINESTRKK